MELYVVGVGSRCVIANDRLQVWDGEGWGKLDFARFFRSRTVAQIELERIKATMKTCVHRVGAEDFPRFVIVNEDHEVWNGASFGHIRAGLIYAHRNLAEADAAQIEADRSDFFQSE